MHIATQINDTPYVTGCNLQKDLIHASNFSTLKVCDLAHV